LIFKNLYTIPHNDKAKTGFFPSHLLKVELMGHDTACQSKNQAMRSNELSVKLRDKIVSRQRSGEGYQDIYAALKVPKNTAASIIKGRSLEPPRPFLELAPGPN
jgi:hypothetical protein